MAPFVCFALTLFAIVMGLNHYILAVPPKKLPNVDPGAVLQTPFAPAEAVQYVRAEPPFPEKRCEANEDGVLLIFAGSRTVGFSHRRTHGHWLFVHIAPIPGGSVIRTYIKQKWPLLGRHQKQLTVDRHAQLAAHVKATTGAVAAV